MRCTGRLQPPKLPTTRPHRMAPSHFPRPFFLSDTGIPHRSRESNLPGKPGPRGCPAPHRGRRGSKCVRHSSGEDIDQRPLGGYGGGEPAQRPAPLGWRTVSAGGTMGQVRPGGRPYGAVGEQLPGPVRGGRASPALPVTGHGRIFDRNVHSDRRSDHLLFSGVATRYALQQVLCRPCVLPI